MMRYWRPVLFLEQQEDFEGFGFALGGAKQFVALAGVVVPNPDGPFLHPRLVSWLAHESVISPSVSSHPFVVIFFVNYYCLLSPLSCSNFIFAGFAQCAGLRVQRGGGHLAAASSQPVPSQRELLVWGWPGARRCNCGIV